MDTDGGNDDEKVSPGKRTRVTIERKAKRKLIKCSKCDMNFTNESSLADHWLMTHVETSDRPSGSRRKGGVFGSHTCKICKKTYSQLHILKKHLRFHEGEFHCRKCSWGFKTPELRKEHEATHKPIQCKYCPRTFLNSSNHKNHERTHTGERPYACADCPKAFPRLNSLHYHLKAYPTHRARKEGEEPKITHDETGDLPSGSQGKGEVNQVYTCNICDKKYTKIVYLKKHLHSHDGEFRCKKCGYGFKTPELLAEHEVNHKTFQCRYCARCFMSSGNHKVHERTHTKDRERPYACADCPKYYPTLSGILYHLGLNPTHRQKEMGEEAELVGPPREAAQNSSDGRGKRKREWSECVFPNCNAKFPSNKLLNRHIKIVHKTKERSGEVVVIDVDDDSSSSDGSPQIGEEEEEESGVVLCLLCCFSFYRDDDSLPENLTRSCEFDQFVREVLKGHYEMEGKSCTKLLSPFRNLSVCQDCRVLIRMTMKQRQAVIETGKRVRKKEVEPRALWEELAEYGNKMRRIDEAVTGGDAQCLEGRLRRAENRKGVNCWVRTLREKIGSYASKLKENSERLRLKGGVKEDANTSKTTGLGRHFQVKSEVEEASVVTID